MLKYYFLDKKRKKQEAAAAKASENTGTAGALTEEEITEILRNQTEKFESFDDEALQEFVDILFPKLSELYQRRRFLEGSKLLYKI